MSFVKEIDRFDVEDERGISYAVVHLQRFIGQRGDEFMDGHLYQTDNGSQVNQDQQDPEVFFLPFGITSPWIAARRKR